MSENTDYWATDAPISYPEPYDPSAPVVESFGAFGFSMNGMVHDLTDADLEDLLTPTFAPDGFRGTPYAGPIEGKGSPVDREDL